MCGVVVGRELLAKGCKVGVGDVAHVLDVLMVVVVQEFVAKGVYLPGECGNNVCMEIL